MAENRMGTDSSNCGGISVHRLPSPFRRTVSGFLPRNTRVSMGSRRGSMGGFVTCEALMRIRSQYTGRGWGLPMELSSTPPVDACLYISLMVAQDQFAFSRRQLSFFTILMAWVGQKDTQR